MFDFSEAMDMSGCYIEESRIMPDILEGIQLIQSDKNEGFDKLAMGVLLLEAYLEDCKNKTREYEALS